MSKVQKPTPIEFHILKHFWRASLQFKHHLLLMVCIPVSAILVGSVVPLLIGKTLAALVVPHGQPNHYIPYLIAAGALGFITNRIGYLSLLTLQAKALSVLQAQAFTTLLTRSVGFHNNRVSGKLVSDANDYPQGFVQLSNALVTSVIPFAVTVLAGIVLVFFNSWILGVLLVVMAAYTIGSGYIGTRGRTSLRIERHKASKRLISHMADAIVNHQTVKTFAREEAELAQHAVLNEDVQNRRIHDWLLAVRDNNVRLGVLTAFQIGLVIAISYLTRRDPTMLGAGIFAFTYTVTLVNKLTEINITIRTIEDGFLQAIPMAEVLEETPEILDKPDAVALDPREYSVTFKDVVFRYQDSTATKNVFTKLNIAIKPGEKVGLAGPSGGGKSTLTRLMLRFEDIEDGEILIDQQNIADVTQASLRQTLTYVPQEPLLFHRTVRENIAYGKPDATDQEIIEAARAAYAHDFIETLPDGYDTIVGERGVKLSGGQRQRIAIARAMLKNSPILVLDEATSALDSESEALIQEGLWKLMEGHTALVIAHRLSTIQKMDRILVLDNGEIVEQGTHAELLKQKGLYAKLWKHQSGGFIDD
jgi:ATP-binding cassette, subfamily B, bacterial